MTTEATAAPAADNPVPPVLSEAEGSNVEVAAAINAAPMHPMTMLLDAHYVQKDAVNKFHGYRYASAEAVTSKIATVMQGANLHVASCEHEIIPLGDGTPYEIIRNAKGGTQFRWLVKCTVFLSDSSRRSYGPFCAYGEGMDAGDKGLTKAETAAWKYAIAKASCTNWGDDPEADIRTDAFTSPPADGGQNGNGNGRQESPRRDSERQPAPQTPVNRMKQAASTKAGQPSEPAMPSGPPEVPPQKGASHAKPESVGLGAFLKKWAGVLPQSIDEWSEMTRDARSAAQAIRANCTETAKQASYYQKVYDICFATSPGDNDDEAYPDKEVAEAGFLSLCDGIWQDAESFLGKIPHPAK